MVYKGNYKIYLIISDKSEHFYIGKTNDIKQRWRQHICDSNNKQKTFIHKWLMKHKDDAEIITINKGLTETQSLLLEKNILNYLKIGDIV